MKWKKIGILIMVVMAGVLTGCSATVQDASEEKADTVQDAPKEKADTVQDAPEKKAVTVGKSILQPDANKKYQYANDGAVYVDTTYRNENENQQIEQWSLEGTLQQTYTLPVKQDEAYTEILYVNNEELFYYIEEEIGRAWQIMRVPIRQTEDGQELLIDQQEAFQKVDDMIEYGWSSCLSGNVFYANQKYIVWITSKRLHVYDRNAKETREITDYQELAENPDLDYCLPQNERVSVCSSVCGERIIFNKEPFVEEGKCEVFVYSFGEAKAERIDVRCDTGVAYITDPDRQKVYYQITEDQSVWEYDCESGEKRERIPEEIFRNCYEKEGLEWIPEGENHDFFLQGDILYVLRISDGLQLFSYSLVENTLKYERDVTEKLHQCIKAIQQENGADRYYKSAIVILEGKLLYFTDYEQYYCIDLEKADTKRVYEDDVEKLYFVLLGEKVEVKKD